MTRLWLAAVTLFWVTMNVFLWRSEYGGATSLGSALPVEVVWSKIIETPDSSGLEIQQHGEKIGFCRWSVVQETPIEEGVETSLGQDELDGMIEDILGYQIQLEGNLYTGQDKGRYLRFGLSTHLEADGATWTEFDARVGLKGNWLQVRATEGSDTVKLLHTYEGSQSEFNLALNDLKNPGALLQSLGVPMPWVGLPLLTGMPLGGGDGAFNLSDLTAGVEWKAGSEFVTVAHTRVRVYFLRARLFEGYSINLMLSRAGEILRAELPNDIVLVNESFTGL